MRELGKLYTAMMTPMTTAGDLNLGLARDLSRKLVDEGSDGLVVAGTTGESPTLSQDEKLRLLDTVLASVGDRADVWFGTGSYDTSASVALTRAAERAGAHGAMVVAPYYNKPSQEGLIAHFRAIADASSLRVMLYNVPSRTSVNVLPETILAIRAKNPNVVAVKEASGVVEAVATLRRADPDLRIYSGDDKLTLPILSVGGNGIVSVAAHLVGHDIRAMIEAYEQGAVKRALDLHLRLLPLFLDLFIGPNPAPLKWCMRACGFAAGPLRLPLVDPTEAQQRRLQATLGELELLPA